MKKKVKKIVLLTVAALCCGAVGGFLAMQRSVCGDRGQFGTSVCGY